jgi:hypothetical protein
MPLEELWARAVVFAQYENGEKEYDWETMKFIEPLLPRQ